MVPFRESKLTRMLQNFFNGSGKAAMIVNVSQCASMFDDTLHVFKFSAIAKQVKYVEKPAPKPFTKPARKVNLPVSQRPSIAWETRGLNFFYHSTLSYLKFSLWYINSTQDIEIHNLLTQELNKFEN